jgi:hypothetical protein
MLVQKFKLSLLKQKTLPPRAMIPEAVFHEFPAKTLRKLAVSDRNPPENTRNSMQESGNRISLPVLTDSCRFRAEVGKSGHRIRLPEYHRTGRFRAGLLDLGREIHVLVWRA